MANAEEENYTQEICIHSRYFELIHLLECYNRMIVKIQQLLIRQQQLLKKQAAAEYQALQMQITPHFLYNSLDSINCLAQIKREPEISAMVRGLAHIFQYNMKFDSGDILLKDEIAHVKNYCILQAINYQDRFSVSYDIPPDMMNRHVIKFMLQPLVENAIVHGMKKTDANGHIEILASEDDDFLTITVKDNGEGMTDIEAEDLRKELALSRTGADGNINISSHIGLGNVNRRLGYYYGNRAEIRFETAEHRGMAIKSMVNWGELHAELVGEAGRGDEILELLDKKQTDLLITDIKMPGKDGLYVLKQVQIQYPDLETIVISAYDEFDYAKQALKAGSVDYILKPVDPDELNAAIAKAQNRQRLGKNKTIEYEAGRIMMVVVLKCRTEYELSELGSILKNYEKISITKYEDLFILISGGDVLFFGY